MKYALNNELEIYKFEKRYQQLKGKGAVVELIEKTFKTLNQNNYFHLALQFYGSEVGYTLEEVKQLCKNYACKDIYWYEKGGLKICRSTANLSKEEMTAVIDRFIHWSAITSGISIPPADRTEFWKQFSVEASKNPYLGG